MRRWLASAVCVVCLTTVGQIPAADKPVASNGFADSPTAIHPILVGASVPAVSLVGTDGTPVALAEVVAAAPSVIIFYRGGW